MSSVATPVVHQDPDPAAWPPVWKIWANPILRRYARSRLRPRGFGVWILLTLLTSGFIFFTTRSVSIYQIEMDIIDAERSPLIPLLVFQGIILFLLGTGQVAGGMTAEADEGVLDYQRLAPMSPLAKVLGYLFGLPIREYFLVLLTMPFTIWAFWRGQVPAWGRPPALRCLLFLRRPLPFDRARGGHGCEEQAMGLPRFHGRRLSPLHYHPPPFCLRTRLLRIPDAPSRFRGLHALHDRTYRWSRIQDSPGNSFRTRAFSISTSRSLSSPSFRRRRLS